MNRSFDKAQPGPVALFVSDVHLQQSMPRTAEAFLAFLRGHAAQARQLYLLGDLFEYWAGDDDIDDSFHRQIVEAIRAVADTGMKVFWIAGNRDFLVGERFAAAAGMTLLPDPSVLNLAGLRIALAHGDAQCTDDRDYMAFRAKVRDAEWQHQFLALPLAQRRAIIDGMRAGSKEAQRGKSYEIMDVNPSAIASLFDEASVDVLVHGHTHRPGRHDDASTGRTRYVLPDWDCDGSQRRGGWLELGEKGEWRFRDADGNPIEPVIRTAS